MHMDFNSSALGPVVLRVGFPGHQLQRTWEPPDLLSQKLKVKPPSVLAQVLQGIGERGEL